MSFSSSPSPAWVAAEFSVTAHITVLSNKYIAPSESVIQIALPVSIGSGSPSAIQHANRKLGAKFLYWRQELSRLPTVINDHGNWWHFYWKKRCFNL